MKLCWACCSTNFQHWHGVAAGIEASPRTAATTPTLTAPALRVSQHWLTAPVAHMFQVILSKPLWSTATCSAHFQASQFWMPHRKAWPALAWAFFYWNLGKKTSVKLVCTLTKLPLQRAFLQMGADSILVMRFSPCSVLVSVLPILSSPHPSLKHRMLSNTTLDFCSNAQHDLTNSHFIAPHTS